MKRIKILGIIGIAVIGALLIYRHFDKVKVIFFYDSVRKEGYDDILLSTLILLFRYFASNISTIISNNLI